MDVPIFVMMFFFAIFALVLWRIASTKRSAHYRAMADLPLGEELS